jgi:hypothetical protein
MNYSKRFGIVAIASVAVMLIASTAAVQEDAFAAKKKYEQKISQANDCGNDKLPMYVYCQNLATQLQGDANAMNIIGAQG